MTLAEDANSAGGPPPDARSRWNARYSGRNSEAEVAGPPPALIRLVESAQLPGEGLAIDIAGGDGRGALWLAERGFTPVLVDVSDVALGLAADRAAAAGVDLLTFQIDLHDQTLGSVIETVVDRAPPDVPVAVVSCLHYLNRGLLASVAEGLLAGATFLAAIATVTNLERHQKPSARFLLEPGELRRTVHSVGRSDHRPDLDLIHHFEGWNADGTHEADIVVRRPRHSSDWVEWPMHRDRSQR